MTHTFTEGGQITTHRFRMFKQVIKLPFFVAFSLTLVLFAISMFFLPKVGYSAAWYYVKAQAVNGILAKIEVSREFITELTHTPFAKDPHLPPEYVIKITEPLVIRLVQDAYTRILYSLTVSSVLGFSIFIFFVYQGRIAKKKKHLSGSRIVSAWRIRLSLILKGKASPIHIGPLPLIKGTETQHIMVTGGTGSGKTNCLHHLLAQIQDQKQKVIIIDTTGVFTERYFRQGKDFLLNPLHPDSEEWSPWAEGETQADFASLAEALIPASRSDSDNYWNLASRTVLTCLLTTLSSLPYKQNTSELMQWIQRERLAALCKMLEGTKAAAHMDIAAEKTASSVRSVACSFVECLEHLKDTDEPFSIRNWIKEEDDSWLFLQCKPQERALIRPLLAAWISSAIRGLLALPIDLNRRIWFVIDELPTLQRIKDLETLLTEGRKYGGCGIISLQSPAQLENIYGRDLTKIIIGNTATKVIFRERDPEIAERISHAFGSQEVMEIQEGISYGASEVRDGVNLSMQNKTRPVISASQILELPINTAFIKLAEEQAVAKINLPIKGNKSPQ